MIRRGKVFSIVLIAVSVLVIDTGGCCAAGNRAADRERPEAAVKVSRTDTGRFYDGPGKNTALIYYSDKAGKADKSLLKELAEKGADCFLVRVSPDDPLSERDKAGQIMKGYSYKHWYLAGNYRGGALAADYAADHSEELEGLILLSSYSARDLSGCTLKVLSIYSNKSGDKWISRIRRSRPRMPDSYEEYRIEGGNFAWYMNYGKRMGRGTVTVSVGKNKRLEAEKMLDMMGIYNGKRGMRILMLGNSLTYYNKMPRMLAELTGAEVVAHTQGNTGLEAHQDPKTRMGRVTQPALENEKWDYVILQGMSYGPVVSRRRFIKDISSLCREVRAKGAVPVLFATWAYKKGSKKLERRGVSYEGMYRTVYRTYHKVGKKYGVPVADVGKAFYKVSKRKNLYLEDQHHPNKTGSKLAAKLLAEEIMKCEQGK